MSLDATILEYVIKHVNNTSLAVARLVKMMYGNIFRTVVNSKSSKTFIWQECIDGIWQDMPKILGLLELHKRITDTIPDYINEAKKITKQQRNETTNMIEADYCAMHLKELHKLESNIYSRPFRNSIIKECEFLFYNN
jgi:hypothetical protein